MVSAAGVVSGVVSAWAVAVGGVAVVWVGFWELVLELFQSVGEGWAVALRMFSRSTIVVDSIGAYTRTAALTREFISPRNRLRTFIETGKTHISGEARCGSKRTSNILCFIIFRTPGNIF